MINLSDLFFQSLDYDGTCKQAKSGNSFFLQVVQLHVYKSFCTTRSNQQFLFGLALNRGNIKDMFCITSECSDVIVDLKRNYDKQIHVHRICRVLFASKRRMFICYMIQNRSAFLR